MLVQCCNSWCPCLPFPPHKLRQQKSLFTNQRIKCLFLAVLDSWNFNHCAIPDKIEKYARATFIFGDRLYSKGYIESREKPIKSWDFGRYHQHGAGSNPTPGATEQTRDTSERYFLYRKISAPLMHPKYPKPFLTS